MQLELESLLLTQSRNPVLKRIFIGIASIVLFFISAFFVAIVASLTFSEVTPAIKQGSLNVETSTMILNQMWEGNEIYLLLAAYLLLACVSAYGAIRIGTKAMRRQR